jgi:general secretion pathway protein K
MTRRRSRGAALLTALVIVAVIATVAAGMVWQQWRAVQVETAERARTQSAWILAGALDWARLILREDARTSGATPMDHLGEPWAIPLAEARLSTFLAAEAQVEEDAPDAFLAGSISDATARLNLANLVDVGRVPNPTWVAALQRLCQAIGLSPEVGMRIAAGMRAAAPPAVPASGASAPAEDASADRPLVPQTVAQLAWFGLEPEAIRALEPYVVILPTSEKTLVNVNTAPPEVLMAAIEGLDRATAERIVQVRQRLPFKDRGALKSQLAALPDTAYATTTAVTSGWFEVRGRMRLDSVVLEQKSLVNRVNRDVRVVRRERISSVDAGVAQPVEK